MRNQDWNVLLRGKWKQPPTRTIPFSSLFFVSAFVIYLLQHVVVLNVFLLFLFAVFWSVLLVNAGMIGIAIEAALGLVSRLWLVVPILFYGGYWTAAVLDRSTVQELSAAIRASNTGLKFDFDATKYALVFERDWPRESGVPILVDKYDLPVEYVNDDFYADPVGYFSNRLVDEAVCRKIKNSKSALILSLYVSPFHEKSCVASMLEVPRLPIVFVSHREEDLRVGTLPVRKITISVKMPDGQIIELHAGRGDVLTWFPAPIAGYLPNLGLTVSDAGEKLEFDRLPVGFVEGESESDRMNSLLARALGLSPLGPGHRNAEGSAILRSVLSNERPR